MTELFNQVLSKEAILLIDASGSVTNRFNSEFASTFDKMEAVIKNLPEEKFKVCFWNSNNEANKTFTNGILQYPYTIRKDNIGQIFKHVKGLITGNCGTFPHLGINGINPDWMKTSSKIYFVTDGQMSNGYYDEITGISVSANFSNSVTKLFATYPKAQLQIITVEARNVDFRSAETLNSAAGSDIYKVITNNKLTNYVHKFTSYTLNNEGFVQLNKNIPPPGHLPFGSTYFSETKMAEFVQYIRELIVKNSTEDELLKIVQDLSSTLSYLTKDKPVKLVDQIINQFCSIFNGTVLDPMFVKYILADSIKKELGGQANIYAQYRQKLQNLYKEANNLLLQNVVNSINVENRFVTFPIYNKIVTGHKSLVTEDICDSERFCKGAIKVNHMLLPVLPFDKGSAMNDQCLRQWVRQCISKLYSVNKLEDIVMYIVMYLNLQVSQSELPGDIKQVFRNLVTTMFRKKRLNSDTTELDRLINGDAPVPNSGKINDFYNYMSVIGSKFQIPYKPMTIWYLMCKAYDKDIAAKQLDHCIASNLFEEDVLELVVPNITHYDIPVESTLDYSCIITLDDTSITGGYRMKPHVSNYGSTCSPIYVFSDLGYENYVSNPSTITCPICYTKLDISSFEKVGPKVENDVVFFTNDEVNVFDNVIKTSKPIPYASSSSSSTKVTNMLTAPKNGKKKVCITMKGTVGAGKSTMSELIKTKVEAMGGHCLVVGTDKYMQQGFTTAQAINKIKEDMTALNDIDSDLIVLVVDTCGERAGGNVFDIRLQNWKTLNVFPNYDKNDMKGYMAWSLRNVLNRTNVTPNCYLKPGTSSVDTCIMVHTKKAKALFGKSTIPAINQNVYSVDKAISLLSEADLYQYPIVNTIEKQVDALLAKI